MKSLNIVVASILVTAIFTSCKKTDINSTDRDTDRTGKGAVVQPESINPVPVSPCSNYSVTLDRYYLSRQTTTFIWKIYNDQPKTLKDLKEWRILLSNTVAKSIQAAYIGNSLESMHPIDPVQAYGDNSDNCYSGPAFTFGTGTRGEVPTYYSIVLTGYFAQGSSHIFLTSKGQPDCCERFIDGVGNEFH